jgi:hypothetical protein
MRGHGHILRDVGRHGGKAVGHLARGAAHGLKEALSGGKLNEGTLARVAEQLLANHSPAQVGALLSAAPQQSWAGIIVEAGRSFWTDAAVLFLLAHSRRPLSLLADTVGCYCWLGDTPLWLLLLAWRYTATPVVPWLCPRVLSWHPEWPFGVCCQCWLSPQTLHRQPMRPCKQRKQRCLAWPQQQVLVGVCYGVHDLCFQAGGSHAPPIVAAARAGCFMCTCWHHGLLRSLL